MMDGPGFVFGAFADTRAVVGFPKDPRRLTQLITNIIDADVRDEREVWDLLKIVVR